MPQDRCRQRIPSRHLIAGLAAVSMLAAGAAPALAVDPTPAAPYERVINEAIESAIDDLVPQMRRLAAFASALRPDIPASGLRGRESRRDRFSAYRHSDRPLGRRDRAGVGRLSSLRFVAVAGSATEVDPVRHRRDEPDRRRQAALRTRRKAQSRRCCKPRDVSRRPHADRHQDEPYRRAVQRAIPSAGRGHYSSRHRCNTLKTVLKLSGAGSFHAGWARCGMTRRSSAVRPGAAARNSIPNACSTSTTNPVWAETAAAADAAPCVHRQRYFATSVCSGGRVRTGAPTLGSGGCSTAFAVALSPAAIVSFPAPATSNAACEFPHYAHLFASCHGLWDLSD